MRNLMRWYWWSVVVIAVVVLVGTAAAGGYFLGDVQAVKGLSIQRTSPRQLAEAMRQDRFYSDYRKSSLLVTGTVASVSRGGGQLIVGFATGSSYGASCDLGAAVAAPRVGQTFTVLALGEAAERLPAGVLLRGAVIP